MTTVLMLEGVKLTQYRFLYLISCVKRNDHKKQCFSLLNDGAKRNHSLYLKIMYTQVRKILHLR
jgi:hypothetical protein